MIQLAIYNQTPKHFYFISYHPQTGFVHKDVPPYTDVNIDHRPNSTCVELRGTGARIAVYQGRWRSHHASKKKYHPCINTLTEGNNLYLTIKPPWE